jgi:hypothetical protein
MSGERASRLAVAATLLAALAALVAVGIINYQAVTQSRKLVAVLTLGVFALLCAVVLVGLLRATGVVKTRKYQVTGAAAVFVVVFGSLLTAYATIDSEWRLRGRVKNLGVNQVATIHVGNDCTKATDSEGYFEIVIANHCLTNGEAKLVAKVDGDEVSESISTNKDYIEIVWLPQLGAPRVIKGIALIGSRPLVSARMRSTCPTVKPTETSATGSFELSDVDASCYPLTIFVDAATGEPVQQQVTAIAARSPVLITIADPCRVEQVEPIMEGGKLMKGVTHLKLDKACLTPDRTYRMHDEHDSVLIADPRATKTAIVVGTPRGELIPTKLDLSVVDDAELRQVSEHIPEDSLRFLVDELKLTTLRTTLETRLHTCVKTAGRQATAPDICKRLKRARECATMLQSRHAAAPAEVDELERLESAAHCDGR